MVGEGGHGISTWRPKWRSPDSVERAAGGRLGKLRMTEGIGAGRKADHQQATLLESRRYW